MKPRVSIHIWMIFAAGAIVHAPQCGMRADADERFWSFQPVRPVETPSVEDSHWTSNAIDAFILEQLEERQLRPSPAADKRTLIRRATFDLTGVPPTPGEIESFLDDD